MQRDVRAYLWDVCEAADKIFDFISGLDLKHYADTPVVHSAVERKFLIIGEALSQMAKLNPNWARRIPEIAEIIAFRNVVAALFFSPTQIGIRRKKFVGVDCAAT